MEVAAGMVWQFVLLLSKSLVHPLLVHLLVHADYIPTKQ
jgi:hypothetical protein